MGKKDSSEVADKLQKVAAGKPKKKAVSAATVFIAIMGVVAAIVGPSSSAAAAMYIFLK